MCTSKDGAVYRSCDLRGASTALFGGEEAQKSDAEVEIRDIHPRFEAIFNEFPNGILQNSCFFQMFRSFHAASEARLASKEGPALEEQPERAQDLDVGLRL